MANNPYQMFGQLPTLPQYRSSAPTSTMGQIPQGGYNFNTLAQAADQERLAQQQRANDRQNAVIGGYDQQIQNSRAMGDQGYQRLASDYDLLTADARDTRTRNMERIDKFGNSMRSDLNIKAQQNMASASQDAIKRGLGNTTVANSLQRGAQFDNTRQQLALEDQLLTNRIATDTNLSAAYQGTLQNRATGLNQQFNQNLANENSLTSQRLGYIGGIQENTDGLGIVSNLYAQGLGMENDNTQKGLDRALTVSESALERDARTREADIDRSWKAGETAKERDSRIAEAELDRKFQSTESTKSRASQEKLAKLDITSREKISDLDRAFQQQESRLSREMTISQAALDRAFQGDQSLLQREAQKQEAEIDRRWKEQQAKLDRAWQGKESAADREARKQEAELDRQWQQRQAEQERNTKIAEAQKDREQQTKESEKDRTLTIDQNEKNRIADDDPRYGQPKRNYSIGGYSGAGLYARPNAIPYDGVIGGY